ncbi:hypothetical protein ACOME3_007549 [Neoechinorhynchus agilis]
MFFFITIVIYFLLVENSIEHSIIKFCSSSEIQFRNCQSWAHHEVEIDCIKKNTEIECLSIIASDIEPTVTITEYLTVHNAKFLIPNVESLKILGKLSIRNEDYSVVVSKIQTTWSPDGITGVKICSTGFQSEWLLPMNAMLSTLMSIPVESEQSYCGTFSSILSSLIGESCILNDDHEDSTFWKTRELCLKTLDCDMELTRSALLDECDDSVVLLCPDGSTASVKNAESCNFGRLSPLLVISNSLVNLSFPTKFLKNEKGICGTIEVNVTIEQYTESDKVNFVIPSVDLVCKIPVRICVTSTVEFNFCQRLLKRSTRNIDFDNLEGCVQARNNSHCVEKIANGEADTALLNSYEAAISSGELVSVAREIYGTENEDIYVVAVVKRIDTSIINLWSLRGKIVRNASR